MTVARQLGSVLGAWAHGNTKAGLLPMFGESSLPMVVGSVGMIAVAIRIIRTTPPDDIARARVR